ncbi:beta-lactamase family protein [Actinomadura barringtoniae]|uniref:Beta-lactamase family protein n=1 Tax=Actinomadura barringtoniae TaxID=1427535 RepID=A0A939T2N7_9ACTN|nr:serine hydrolase domain-containing protein [Actinomadura barringtoniae]MBO2445524.1 beta-lactamase family protein [Actinomadura barringtoniae]
MTELHDVLQRYVDDRTLPGAVGLVARGDRVEVATAGSADLERGIPMARDSIFRIASITKPITATAVMMLVEEGRIALDDPIGRWLPELAAPMVVRTPQSPVDDVVPALRPITVEDLLTFRSGLGWPAAELMSAPQVAMLAEQGQQKHGRDPQRVSPPDEWMAAYAKIPLLHQPGEAFLYHTGSDLQGVLIARVTGRTLPDFFAERIFEPLGMKDTGFAVPAADRDRFTGYYNDGLELLDGPDGQWSTLPAFASGGGGLVSTADDWLTFARMLLANGGDLLSPESVRLMTTDQLTQAQRDGGALYLEGQGWGYGGSVDVAPVDPWNVPGRYGWVGGTGTAAHLTPSTGTVTILLTQLAANGPVQPQHMHDFWQYAA